jgi:hypothetical protein
MKPATETQHASNPSKNTNRMSISRKGKVEVCRYGNTPLKKGKADWNHSTSTWRHSSIQHRFPKAPRFQNPQPNSTSIVAVDLPTTRTSVSFSMGYGHKQPICENTLRNALLTPSPATYVAAPHRTTGWSMGQGWEAQEKRYIGHRKDVYSPHFTVDNPSHVY